MDFNSKVIIKNVFIDFQFLIFYIEIDNIFLNIKFII